MNRIFLFDIDGTISYNGKINDTIVDLFKKLRLNKDIVMLSTGRCLGQMKDIMNILDIDGAILNNGSYAYIGDDVIYDNPISNDIIKEMYNDGLHLSILTKNSFVKLDDNDDVFNDFIKVFNIPYPNTVDMNYLNENRGYSLGVYSYDLDNVDISKYKSLRFVKVCSLGYDVINAGVTKASAIKYIKEKYKNYKIISFGDNYNDIEMLKESDISISMGNAPDDVKKICDYVTLSVEEDGVVYAINNLLKE